MSSRSKRQCPGPAEGTPCYGNGLAAPRGGRCVECRRARMNWQGRKRTARLRGLDPSKVELRKIIIQKKYLENKNIRIRREKEVGEALRRLEPVTLGIRGAIKVLDIMQRVA